MDSQFLWPPPSLLRCQSCRTAHASGGSPCRGADLLRCGAKQKWIRIRWEKSTHEFHNFWGCQLKMFREKKNMILNGARDSASWPFMCYKKVASVYAKKPSSQHPPARNLIKSCPLEKRRRVVWKWGIWAPSLTNSHQISRSIMGYLELWNSKPPCWNHHWMFFLFPPSKSRHLPISHCAPLEDRITLKHSFSAKMVELISAASCWMRLRTPLDRWLAGRTKCLDLWRRLAAKQRFGTIFLTNMSCD